MTADDLKKALAEGTSQSKLVLQLIREGHDESTAWNLVRAAGLVNMTEELTVLAASAPTEDGESYGSSDGRIIMLAAKMTVDAAELLKMLSAPLQTPGAAAPQP